MPDVYAIFHQPLGFPDRSSLLPLVEMLSEHPIRYGIAWEELQARSWTLGHLLRRMGNRYYGSEWNAWMPWIDEWRYSRGIADRGCIVHFFWGEFARPTRASLFRKKGNVLIGTFHCSATRLPSVLAADRDFHEFDWITLMSKTQMDFFLARGFPKNRLRVILHGVDTKFFHPAQPALRREETGLRCLLVGSTERDHVFAADVFSRLHTEQVALYVRTDAMYHDLYKKVEAVRLLPPLSPQHLLEAYQQADLLFMPLLDCTANNTLLEAMACGTPVLTNRVGGVPEYVDSTCNFVMDGKRADEWVNVLTDLACDRQELARRRVAVRVWAKTFEWTKLAPKYMALYEEVMSA